MSQGKDKKNKLKIAPIGILDNIVFSKSEAWAYYKVSTVPYEFLDSNAQTDLAERTTDALASLCQKAGEKVDCHILITTTPFSVDAWVEQMDKIHKDWIKQETVSYNKFIDMQAEELWQSNYKKRVVYLGVKLFSRGSFNLSSYNIFEFGLKESIQAFNKNIANLFSLPTDEIPANEYDRAKNAEKEIYRILINSELHVIKPSSEEMLLTIKKQFYPAMPSPGLEIDHENRIGLNDIVLETGGVIDTSGHRYLKFKQVIGVNSYESYRATLSFSKFPKDTMVIPDGIFPFMYFPTFKGLPWIVSSRFSLIPSQDMSKEIENKKLESNDELKDLSRGGRNITSAAAETLQDIDEAEEEINKSKLPWVSGSYRITIETTNLDTLHSAAAFLKQEYAGSKIILTWSSGDQLDLFLEEIPGSKLLVKSYNQMTNLSMLGISGFNFGGDVGDPIQENTKKIFHNKR